LFALWVLVLLELWQPMRLSEHMIRIAEKKTIHRADTMIMVMVTVTVTVTIMDIIDTINGKG
jgi:hypothetical protein